MRLTADGHTNSGLAYRCQVSSPWMMRTTAAEHRGMQLYALYICVDCFVGSSCYIDWIHTCIDQLFIVCIQSASYKAWLCSVSVHGWGLILRRLPVNGRHALVM